MFASGRVILARLATLPCTALNLQHNQSQFDFFDRWGGEEGGVCSNYYGGARYLRSRASNMAPCNVWVVQSRREVEEHSLSRGEPVGGCVYDAARASALLHTRLTCSLHQCDRDGENIQLRRGRRAASSAVGWPYPRESTASVVNREWLRRETWNAEHMWCTYASDCVMSSVRAYYVVGRLGVGGRMGLIFWDGPSRAHTKAVVRPSPAQTALRAAATLV